MPHERVTQKMIALAAGVSPMTVSYALRDHPSIRKATRLRIRKMAARLGYAPDPTLSALIAYRNDRKQQQFHGSLGLLTFGPNPNNWKGSRYNTVVFRAIKQRARELGYTVESFWADDPQQSPEALEKILYHRGIRGVFLTIPFKDDQTLPLNFSRFCAVGLSRALDWTGLDFVTTNHYGSCSLAFEQCWRRGYRRIAYATTPVLEDRVGRRLLAAYLERQERHEIPRRQWIPPFTFLQGRPDALQTWLKRHRPEVIISHFEWREDRLIPGNWTPPSGVDLVNPVLLSPDPRMAGVVQPLEDIGIQAVDLLHAKLLIHQPGIPRRAKALLIDGIWQGGASLGKAPPAATDESL